MKKVILLGYLLSFAVISESQITHTLGSLIFTDSLKLKPLNSWITINNPESNIWEIGEPSKTFFNSAHLGKQAIITDSTNTYPNNLNDYFNITIPLSYQWGEGILSFYHKFDTDLLTDGGIIEISYDNAETWKNILDDDQNMDKKLIGIYSDTIKGGEYGFSGKSDGWQYVEIYWLWLMKTKQTFNYFPIVRFRFVSDNENTNKDGWMIDDIVFRGYEVTGKVNEIPDNVIKVFPIPSRSIVNFSIPDKLNSEVYIKLFDLLGRQVISKQLTNNQVDIKDLSNGVYIYKIYNKNNFITSGKLIKD